MDGLDKFVLFPNEHGDYKCQLFWDGVIPSPLLLGSHVHFNVDNNSKYLHRCRMSLLTAPEKFQEPVMRTPMPGQQSKQPSQKLVAQVMMIFPSSSGHF
jgi:hypothetical protein